MGETLQQILQQIWPIVFCVIICLCKIIEVTLSSLKTVLMVKGQRVFATILALIECLIWGFVISGIIKDLSTNYAWLISYCVGYTFGWYLGSAIESKLAFGTTDVQMIVSEADLHNIEKYLIENNFGYFITDCRGKSGVQHKIDVILPRKKAIYIRKEITALCQNNVFVVNYDVPYARGGYGVRNKK